ncbi:gluzincin family metallopeptidase, partial [Cellulomonas bogoriensis]|uniref:hypothetical protein n=1 Tax=Cellulomonas bogoriensis TaxID=301388 RepID=UPI0012EB1B01
MTRGPRLPHLTAALVALGVVSTLAVGAPATAHPGHEHSPAQGPVVASPEDYTPGLGVVAETTYTVDLDDRTINVDLVVRLTNQIRDRVRDGYVEQQYFHTFTVPVLAGAEQVRASRDGGGALRVQVRPGDSDFYGLAEISLSPHLYHGRPQTVRLSYQIPPQPPRSGTLTQVNEAFATFPVFVSGDPGQASVTVRLPAHLEVDVVGDDMGSTTADGMAVYTATDIADPAEWFASVVARDDDALIDQTVTFGEHLVRLQAWPGDDEWLEFTADLAERGLPVLEDAIGVAWAEPRELTIVETSAPYVYGYGGWYEHSRSLIEIGDLLDAHVTLHEMAHAWFNAELFQGRWVNEAMAEVFAAHTMDELGLDAPAPDPVDPEAPGALPLNSWANVDLENPETEEQEAYGYNTSWWVMDTIVDEVGVAGVSQVVQAAAERRSAYPAATTDSTWDQVADWRVLLDHLQDTAGSARAEELFRALVATDEQAADMDARAEARATYTELADAADGWALPEAVRAPMTRWEFDQASETFPELTELVRTRASVVDQLTAARIPVPDALQERFEGAGDLADLRAGLRAADDASR